MIIIESTMLILLLSFGILASISDFKKGKVYNTSVVVFGSAAIILDVVYYSVFVTDVFLDFVLNYCVAAVIALALFLMKCWAGGDTKLMLVLALLYPGRLYLSVNSNIITLCIAVVLSFYLGYFYLVFHTFFLYFSGAEKLQWTAVKKAVCSILLAYIKVIPYIVALDLLAFSIRAVFVLPLLVKFALSVLISYCVMKYALLNKVIWIPLAVIDLVLCIVLKFFPFSLNIKSYILVLVLIVLRVISEPLNYRTILASSVEKGMILSSYSSILLMNAPKKIINRVSKENLDDRLTEEEASSIRAWGKNTDIHLQIVRKIPFAVFITAGFIFYYVGYLLWL